MPNTIAFWHQRRTQIFILKTQIFYFQQNRLTRQAMDRLRILGAQFHGDVLSVNRDIGGQAQIGGFFIALQIRVHRQTFLVIVFGNHAVHTVDGEEIRDHRGNHHRGRQTDQNPRPKLFIPRCHCISCLHHLTLKLIFSNHNRLIRAQSHHPSQRTRRGW